MQKLDRTCVTIPACLASPTPGWKYSQLTGAEKLEIRTALFAMQKQRCAYCERRTGIERDEGHIEHFLKQAGHSHLDLDWPNLFWSCLDERTCGKHKDKCNRPPNSGPQAQFASSDLLNPTLDDPDNYLFFSTDGSVIPKTPLPPADEQRAKETIRVFQLHESTFLKKSREDALLPYKIAIDLLLEAGPEILKKYILTELPRIQSAPFSAVIRQYFAGLH